MRLVVGLGNPGPKYQNNRHNIGFMAADEIVRRHGLPVFRSRFHGDISEGTIGSERVLVLKPMTFMNESGRSVGEAVRFFKLAPEDTIVIHDELDLAAGKVKVKTGGGHAGHNGLRSIEAHLGTRDFRRVRLGIGHPGDKARVHNHVLGDFARADATWVRKLLEAVADEFPALIEGRDSDFMSRVAMTLQPRTVRKERPAAPGSGPSPGPGDGAGPPGPTDPGPAESGPTAGDTPGDDAPTSGTALGAAMSKALSRLKGRS